MYRLIINIQDSLLKLSLSGSPEPSELQRIFSKIENARGQFKQGYRLWIRLPENLRTVQLDEPGKLDLMVYTGKAGGLQKVVIEAPPKCPATKKVVALLHSIYKGLNVPINVVHDKSDALKSLDLLWRSA
jgi:hypothetical protein